MYKFLYKVQDGKCIPCLPTAALLLPSPDVAATPEEHQQIAAVNKSVDKQLSVAVRENVGKYIKLDNDTRMKIAKKCIEIGPRATATFFKEKGLNLNESTVRSIKKVFCTAQKVQKTDNPKSLKNKRGRRLLLGDLDGNILGYVQ